MVGRTGRQKHKRASRRTNWPTVWGHLFYFRFVRFSVAIRLLPIPLFFSLSAMKLLKLSSRFFALSLGRS